MARQREIPDTSAEAQRDTYHHGDLKRALTEAALALVQEKGPKGFTLREVSRRAGVSVAAPYRHFADKAELLAAAATLGFVQLHETLSKTAAKSAYPARQALDMGRPYVRWAVAHPDYYQVIFSSELDKSDKPDLLTAGDALGIAGPVWSLLHGIATLTIGGDFQHVGIGEHPQKLAERALKDLLFV